MKLTRAHIKNYRSIKDMTIDFEPKCRVLVGINESGKTNILRALALLDPERSMTPPDFREVPPDEPHLQDTFVRFVFTLSREERISVYEAARTKLAEDVLPGPVVTMRGKELSWPQLFDELSECVMEVDSSNSRTYSLPQVSSEDCDLATDIWVQPSPTSLPEATVTVPNVGSVPVSDLSFIKKSLTNDLPDGYVERAQIEQLAAFVTSEIIGFVTKHLPECLFWSYDDAFLLPEQLNLDSFAATPGSCEPLRHMFHLAGHTDISGAVSEAKARPHGIRNLLNRVAEQSTKHLQTVWKDYKGISIDLSPNGDNIDASIKDTYNLYDFARRSDGFKRFISFLLMVSTKVKNNELVNTLYLHDEPDTSLHPSGSRYLRDELIKISEQNYVVYSTHSIFMIDRDVIERHLIVEKELEATTVREVNESNILDEEVIYNALGYSVFENLKQQNLIFEGWRDKRLFQVALKSLPAAQHAIRDKLSGLGVCHAKGVKDIGRVTPMLELAAREWTVISDADQPALEHQRAYDGEGPWLRYDELVPDEGVVTGEDFLKIDVVHQCLESLRSDYPQLSEPGPVPLPATEGRLQAVRKWLQERGLALDDEKRFIKVLKENLFSGLESSQIDPKYEKFLSALAERIPPDTA